MINLSMLSIIFILFSGQIGHAEEDACTYENNPYINDQSLIGSLIEWKEPEQWKKLTYGQRLVLQRYPFIAFSLVEATELVHAFVKDLCQSVEYGEESDGVRHLFYSALLSYWIGEETARDFLLAHEFNEKPMTRASLMDVRNNEVGFRIARAHSHVRSDEHFIELIKEDVVQHLDQGKLWSNGTGRTRCRRPKLYPNM